MNEIAFKELAIGAVVILKLFCVIGFVFIIIMLIINWKMNKKIGL